MRDDDKTYLGSSPERYIERLSAELHKLCLMCGYPDRDRHDLDCATLIGAWIDKHREIGSARR